MEVVNAEKLNGLSDEALFALAEKLGLDLPSDLDRLFVLEELLDALKEDSEDRRADKEAPVHVAEKKFSGSELDAYDASLDAAPFIERRYNETMIRVLVRDPSWAFALWDVSDAEMDALEAEGSPEFFLRLVTETNDGKSGESFDIPVGHADMQWYIHLPEEELHYRIDLCCRIKGKARQLARSSLVRAPRSASSGPYDAKGVTKKLFILSGAEDLDIPVLEERHPSRILSGDDIGD